MIFLRSEFGHQLIQKTSLPGKQLGFGNLNWEPATAIDFGEFLHYPGLFGPLHRELVAKKLLRIIVTLECPGLHEFSARLFDLS